MSDYASRRLDADVACTIRARCLHVLRTRGPSTHEQILSAFADKGWDASPSGVRTRCHELAEAGLARDTGEIRPTSCGRPACVWAAT